MEKVIYLESTINLLIQKYGVEYVKELTEAGEVKQIENLVNYLSITN